MARLAPMTLIPLLALALAGCVEVEERLSFEREGNGVYAVTLRWNADALARVRDTVGESVLRAFEGRPFPLSAAVWRDGLTPLTGLEIRRLEELEDAAGWRRIEAEIAFESLADLLRWELLAGRALTITEAGSEAAEDRAAHLTLAPLERLPVLDPLLAAVEARRAPPPQGPASEARRDPAPLAQRKLEPQQIELVERLLVPHLEQVRFAFTLAPAGRVRSAGPMAIEQQERSARFEWRWADLLARKPRGIELRWAPGEFDRVPVISHPADGARTPTVVRDR